MARHWTGAGSRLHPTTVPGGWDAFRRMQDGPQALVLDHELGSAFALDLSMPTVGEVVSPVAGGGTVVRLTRPAFTQAFLDDQMPILRSYADLRLDRMAEIHMQAGDILSFFGALAYLDRAATRRTLDLLWAVLRLCGRLEMRLKMHFDLPRPIMASADLQPIIQTPGHAAWPSGHATEAFAVATVFAALAAGSAGAGTVDGDALVTARDPAMRLAMRIAQNRTVAGMHYPSDSMAGAVLGIGIGEMVVNWLSGQAGSPMRAFDGTGWGGDFDLAALQAVLGSGSTMVAIGTPPAPVMASLWQVARSEWP
jgi:membrane-associated phospholipid phosphatase